MSDPTAFRIVELTGAKRTLELRGRALPYQGFTLEGKQRAEFTWYPGNPVATIQMLGTEESPSTLNGIWKDRFIKTVDFFGQAVETPQGIALFNGRQVADALALTQAVDQIRLGGQLLQVTWDEQVRDGILIRFKAVWTRREDVTWEMEFQWSSRGEAKQPVTFLVAPTIDTLAARLREKVDALIARADPLFEVRDFILRNLDRNLTELDTIASSVESSVTALADLRLTPQQAAERTLASFESVKAAASNIVAIFDAQPASEVEVAGTADTTTVPQNLGRTLYVDAWCRGVRKEARALELLSADETERLRALLDEDDLLAAFIARADSDLRDVSTQFYGNQGGWRRLRKYNNLHSSRLIAGDLILVPKLISGDREA